MCCAEMSFIGHHTLNASDQVQKKLQEETMADKNKKGLERLWLGWAFVTTITLLTTKGTVSPA